MRDNNSMWEYLTGITAVEGTPAANTNPLRMAQEPDGQGGQARAIVDAGTGQTQVVEITPDAYRAAAERHRRRFRAEPSTSINPPIGALLTTLVVGRVRQTEAWVDEAFRQVQPVDRLGQPLHKGRLFYYTRWGSEHLAIIDTELAERAPYKVLRNLPSYHTDELEFHGFAIPMSDEEAQRAFTDLGFAERRFGLGAKILSNWFQWEAVQLITDPTVGVTYGSVTTLGAGSEWDQAGTDPIADMRALIAAVSLATGESEMSIEIKMSATAYNAMLGNATFRDQISANNLGIAFNFTPGGDDVGGLASQIGILAKTAGLLGCRRVSVWRPHGLAPGAAAPGPLLPDMVLAHLSEARVGSDLERDYGQETWAVHWALNRGVPQPEFRIDLTRQQVRPMTREYKLGVVQPDAAAALFNVAS